jgi:hypothetical protein
MSDPSICPESTIESANRRNFIRKVALATAGVGIGSTILSGSRSVIPESSGSSATYQYTDLYVSCKIGIGTCTPCATLCVVGGGGNIHASGSVTLGYNLVTDHGNHNAGTSLNPGVVFGSSCKTGIASNQCSSSSVNQYGLDFYTCSKKRMIIDRCGHVGINETSACSQLTVYSLVECAPAINGTSGASYGGIGVGGVGGYGTGSLGGVGVRGWAWNPCAVAVQALGGLCQTSNILEVTRITKICNTVECVPLTVVNNRGWVGILTCCPIAPLHVKGSAYVTCRVGIGTSTPSTPLDVVGAATVTGGGITTTNPTGYAVHGCSTCSVGVYGYGKIYGVQGCSHSNSGSIGVRGGSFCGTGVVGYSCHGAGVNAISCTSYGLLACSTKQVIGRFQNTAKSGDRSAVAQFANGDSTPVDWNVGVAGLCNSIKVPDGYFYVQHSTSTTPAISVNKCNNHVGIGLANPCRVLCVNGRIHTSCGMGLGTQTINTTLAVNGSFSVKSRQVSSTATLTLSDYVVAANASGAAFTITLPAVSSTAGACNGMMLFIKKTDSSTNAVTVAASGTDTIEGNASLVLKKQYDSLQLVSNNSSGNHVWFILQSARCGVAVS